LSSTAVQHAQEAAQAEDPTQAAALKAEAKAKADPSSRRKKRARLLGMTARFVGGAMPKQTRMPR